MRSYALTINGNEYRAAPLPLGALRDFTRDGTFERLGDAMSSDPMKLGASLDAIVRIISAALMPRYPECDETWVASNVPAGPAGAGLLAAVMRESGMLPAGGEGDGGGNAQSPSV